MQFPAELFMDPGGGTDDTVFDQLHTAVNIADMCAGFHGDESSGGDVVQIEAELPVSVKTSGGHLTEIEGGRTGAADPLKLGNKFNKIFKIVVFFPRPDTGKTGGTEGVGKFLT